jgi:ribonuclease HI
MNGVHSDSGPLTHTIKSNGHEVVDNYEKANLIAKQFASVSSDENCDPRFISNKNKYLTEINTVLSTSILNNDSLEINSLFTSYEIHKAITNLHEKSSPGIDKISYTILKQLPPLAIQNLLDFYNTVWQTGSFPTAWSHSVIIPILKPGKDPTEPISYRPISLTSTLCKLMERLVTDRLTWFLEKRGLLHKNQCGFRKNRSTIDHIAKLQDYINRNLRVGHHTLAVFIDFEKAYDMVWHEGLLLKLVKCGLKGRILTFIKNFLKNRTFQVKIGSILSHIEKLINGTPQGSVISPILFLVVINDMLNQLSTVENSLFADDCSIFRAGTSIPFLEKQLQHALDELQAWCLEWGFKISHSKTSVVLFSNVTVYPEIKLYVDQKLLPTATEFKFLGVIFDRKLTWSQHIDYIADKCKKRLNILKAISSQNWGASKKTLLLLYKSLIRSVIDYGSIAYNSASSKQLHKIELVKNIALRICTGSVANTPIDAMEVDCGELPLHLRRFEASSRQVLKIKYTPHHTSTSLVQDDWRVHYGSFNQSNAPIINKIQPFLNTINNLTVQDIHSVPALPPWDLRSLPVDVTLSHYEKKSANPIVLKSRAMDYIDRNSNCISLYTDASKDPSTGKAGIGLFSPLFHLQNTPLDQSNISLRITDNHSIFTAELVAIKLALQIISHVQCKVPPDTKFVIYSDSLSSLLAIDAGRSHGHPAIINEILTVHQKISASIQLVWIPSHIGILGNEMADSLANQSLRHPNIDLPVKFEILDLFNNLRHYVNDQWQLNWNNSHSFYRSIQPTVSRIPTFCINHNRQLETFINRLRLGRARLNYYLFTVGRHSSGHCDTCDVPETITHFLLHCTDSVSADVKKWCATYHVPLSVTEILNNQTILTKIFQCTKRKL